MEGQSKGSRGLEAYCKGGQGPPRAVAPSKKKKITNNKIRYLSTQVENIPSATCSISFRIEAEYGFSLVRDSEKVSLRHSLN